MNLPPEQEAEQMTAQLEADAKMAVVEAVLAAVGPWLLSDEGKQRMSEALDQAQTKLSDKWHEILELEEAYRNDS
jgi:hypothetical protein